MSDSDDDETPRLSSHTLAALQEFYAEQKQQSDPGGDDKYNIGIIGENWVSKCIPHLSGIMGTGSIPLYICLYLSTAIRTCPHLSDLPCLSASPFTAMSVSPAPQELIAFLGS